MSADTLFAPPDEAWTPLNPRYVTVMRIGAVLLWGALGLLFTGIAIAAYIFENISIAVPIVTGAVFLAILVWRFIRQQAIFDAWGYAERETDLYIRSGIIFRKLVVVPYGRMQAVEVRANPIAQAFKLATVQLVTASADSDAVIPGLDAEAAIILRDRLTERGENQAAGL